MSKIAIKERLVPFSHQAGVSLLLPKSSYVLSIFPTRVVFKDFFIDVGLKGLVREFTVEQDLERGRVRVFGIAKESGYFSFFLERVQEGLLLAVDRIHADVLEVRRDAWISLARKGKHVFSLPKEDEIIPSLEKLSLGKSRKLDFDLVQKRLDLSELLPLIYRLSILVPNPGDASGGTLDLVSECEKLLANREKVKAEEKLKELIAISFHGMLLPMLTDERHLGISLSKPSINASPIALLTRLGRLIRSLFLSEDEEGIHILPNLLPSFHAGRLTNAATKWGTIDLEWTKKELRRLNLHPTSSAPKTLHFPPSLRSCRLRHHPKDRGRRLNLPLHIDSSKIDSSGPLFLDRFEK